MGSLKITVDGVDYDVEVENDGATVTVSDTEGLVAFAERDSATETVLYAYFLRGVGRVDEGALPGLYSKTPEDLACWLASTHPIHG